MEYTRASIKKTLNTDFFDESTSSADLIGSNEDLLTEILVRLPATSILRFKCVSKNWQSLLSHRRFTLRHDKLSISPGFFIRNKYVPFDDKDRIAPPFGSLDFYPDVNDFIILQSCNGLLLCCGNNRYYVFNPTTKQFAIIPLGYSCKLPYRYFTLAYHQTSCPHYKLFFISFSYQNPNSDLILFEIQIYSSDTGKWKNLNHYFFDYSDAPFGIGVYWNGAIYLRPCFGNNLWYFDLKLEHLKKLPIPSLEASMERYGNYHKYLYYGDSRGHLHWVDSVKHESRIYLLVHELLGDDSGWFVKYKMEVCDLPGVCPETIDDYMKFEVIDVVRGEEEEDTFMVLKIKRKMMRYNLLGKSLKPLFDLTTIKIGNTRRIGRSEVYRYIQSLTSF